MPKQKWTAELIALSIEYHDLAKRIKSIQKKIPARNRYKNEVIVFLQDELRDIALRFWAANSIVSKFNVSTMNGQDDPPPPPLPPPPFP